MATLFLDFENGNDNYAGTSFATLADGTDGRISSTTFSSAGASFPNDGSLIGQYLSIFNGTIYAVYNITAWVSSTSLTIAAISGGTALANQAVDRQYYIGGRWKNITTGATAVRTVPGDTIRIMGSPAPTSLGQNGVWTSQALQATKSISSSTNATPIAVTVTGHGYSTGDTVVITGHNTNDGANGTWEITVTGVNTFTLNGSVGSGTGTSGGTVRLRNNTRVMLAAALTANIACNGAFSLWTSADAVNVTTTSADRLNFKEHLYAQTIAIGAGFTTGKAAYFALPSATDFSGYQQVSFWIRQTTGTVGAAGAIALRLCSDNVGATAVNTISIPNLAATGRWMPVTVDLATNLGSSIQSIALYVNTDNGAQTFLLSNIIACKASSAADSLTLTSLIGKNTTGETFWGIQSINGTRVMLDADTNATPTSTSVRGYYGTSETVTTWKRETIKLGPAAASTTALQTIQESGTDGSPITYSGGWDRTAMTTQNLETWLDGVNGNGYGISESSRSWITLDKLAGVRFDRLLQMPGGAFGFTVSLIAINNTTSAGAVIQALTSNFTIGSGVANAGAVVSGNTSTLYNVAFLIMHSFSSNGSGGIFLWADSFSSLSGGSFFNNGASAIGVSGAGYKIKNIVTGSNATNGLFVGIQGDVFLIDADIQDASEISAIASYRSTVISSQNHDQTTDNHKIFLSGALISSATDQRNTASGISWKIQPTSTNRSSTWPVTLSLAKVACAANSLVTIKAWMRRTNTGLTMRLVCKGGQIAGVTSDVVDAMTAAADTWAEQTITFTPTEVGVVEITAEAWGGTTFSGWVDDMTISQA